MADSSKINDDCLEEAFRLIQEGNDQAETKGHWKAADSYSRAQSILQQLAEQSKIIPKPNADQEKIAALYFQQSAEYLQRARGELVSALQYETGDDRKIDTSQGSSSNNGLSDEECAYRMKIFGRLFAKELEDPKTVLEQQLSLEARLQELSDSLPATFKSEKERMRGLNRGLARLGLSLYQEPEQQVQVFGVTDAVPKSESEQVDLIIAQAKDEVAIAGGPIMNDSALAEAVASGKLVATDALPKIDVEDDDNDGSAVTFSTDGEDADLTPAIRNDLHNKLVAAQVSLSELVALFEVDQDNDATIDFEQTRGKHLLKDARLLLRQVTEKWAAS
jgi:hypothetical protein